MAGRTEGEVFRAYQGEDVPFTSVREKRGDILDKVDEDLTIEQLLEFREAFDMFDKSKTGTISNKDLLLVMRTLGLNPTEGEILEIMAEWDKNENGSIELAEFIYLMRKKMRMFDTEEEIRKIFKVFDKNGDGFIDADELRDMMTSMGGQTMSEEEVEAMLTEADLDGDRRINYEEFIRVLTMD